MKIYVKTFVDLSCDGNSHPRVDIFRMREEAEDAYLRDIDPEVAEAYGTPKDERDNCAEELAENAERYLEERVHYGDDFTVSFEKKSVELPGTMYLVHIKENVDGDLYTHYRVALSEKEAVEDLERAVKNHTHIKKRKYGHDEDYAVKMRRYYEDPDGGFVARLHTAYTVNVDGD